MKVAEHIEQRMRSALDESEEHARKAIRQMLALTPEEMLHREIETLKGILGTDVSCRSHP